MEESPEVLADDGEVRTQVVNFKSATNGESVVSETPPPLSSSIGKRIDLLQMDKAGKCLGRKKVLALMSRATDKLRQRPEKFGRRIPKVRIPRRYCPEVKKLAARALEDFLRKKLIAITDQMAEGRRLVTYDNVKSVCEDDNFKFRDVVISVSPRPTQDANYPNIIES